MSIKPKCELIRGDGLAWLNDQEPHSLCVVTDVPPDIGIREIERASRIYVIMGGREFLIGLNNGARIGGEKIVDPYIDLIQGLEADTIVDPFMGTGTTGEAALQCGRNFIGVELKEAHFKIAMARLL